MTYRGVLLNGKSEFWKPATTTKERTGVDDCTPIDFFVVYHFSFTHTSFMESYLLDRFHTWLRDYCAIYDAVCEELL